MTKDKNLNNSSLSSIRKSLTELPVALLNTLFSAISFKSPETAPP